ncbi:MAG: hypothetical protein V2A77_01105 [Pseudomonadota bacterium]
MWLILGLALTAAALGCGRKGLPVAPWVPQPVRAEDVTYEGEDNVLTLRWRYPAEGLPPVSFRVLRAGLDPTCPTCQLRYAEVGLVGANPEVGEKYSVPDRGGLAAGASYVYTVVPIFEGGLEGPSSEPITLVWRAAQPPSGLVAVGVAGGVRLFWEPDAGARGYAVYRAEVLKGAAAAFRLQPLARVETPPWFDSTVKPGGSYLYAVATVDQTGEGTVGAPVGVEVPVEDAAAAE